MSRVKDDIRRGIQNALIDSKIQEDQYPAQYGLTPRAVGDKVQQANNMAAQQQQAAAMGNAAVTQQPTQQMQPAKQPVSYAEMVQKLSPYRTPSKDEIAKQERLRKAQAAISAFGDGASAIANLIATTKGSPNVERPKPNLSDRSMVRWEQLRQERKADADKYYQQMMRAVQADESRDKAQQEYELKKSYYDTRNEKMYQDLQNKSRELDIREFNALVNANFKDMTLQQKERALDIQRELADGRISLMEAQARLNNIKANVGGFAPKSGSRGGSKGAKYVVYDQDGNPHYYDNATMYKQAVEQYGSGLAQTEKVGRKDVRRTTDSKAGELARNAAEKRKAAQQSNTKPQAQQSKTKKGSQGSKGGKYGNTKKLGL